MRADSRNERLYPLRVSGAPGALLKFLHAIGTRWNISLFHYRNHGSDYGRVLAGIQVPPRSGEFALHLHELHYAYTEETANPAYRMFLGQAELKAPFNQQVGSAPVGARLTFPGRDV